MWRSQRFIWSFPIRLEWGNLASKNLPLGKLGLLTRFTQTDFFTFDSSRISRDETRISQGWAKRLIVRKESTSDTMPNRTSLAESTATANRYAEVKFACNISHFQRLPDDHTGSFPTEVFIKTTVIYPDTPIASGHKDSCLG
tara:strand:- start:448 stop:873 length:426 start_codon:yes stop_codon:yes gene_type:complete